MSVLIVQIPARARLRARGAPASASAPEAPADSRVGPSEFSYALSPDGLVLAAQGCCAAALLPKADSVVAVLTDADVSWHRLSLPKAPAARLRAALVGVLEESLLDDAESTHLALPPASTPGQDTWVAAVNRPWLRHELAALEQAQVFVDRVVPSAWPDESPTGHFSEVGPAEGDDAAAAVALTWSSAAGVAVLRLNGGLARSVVGLVGSDSSSGSGSGSASGPSAATPPEGARWTATPAAAAVAEKWLGSPVVVMPDAQRLLQSARTLWNLRQFELARNSRGTRALRDAWRQFMSPAWRTARFGLVALVAAQLVGLNLWAMHQRDEVQARRAAMVSVLQTTFPQVRAVLDAPLQMEREVQSLRTLAGQPGDADFESLLAVAASAWPAGKPPVDSLRFEPGRLSVSAAGWDAAQIEQFSAPLRPGGWQVDASQGLLTLSRAAPLASPLSSKGAR